MIQNSLILIGTKLYLQYSFLRKNGISNATIFSWQQRNISVIHKVNNNAFVEYDSIPITTKSKLPSKDELLGLAWLQDYDNKTSEIYESLQNTCSTNFKRFVEYYKVKYNLDNVKSVQFAKDHAIWNWIVNVYTERNLEALYKAYSKIYPKRYSSKNSFSNAMRKAKVCVESVVFDKRLINSPLNVKKVSIDNAYWVAAFTSIGKKYGPVDIYNKLLEICQSEDKKAPSLSWVKKYHKQIKKNPAIFESRSGAMASRSKKETYASIIHALNANDQWQIDGWTLPFWGKGFQRYVLVVVRDAYSKKIVGYSISKSENTLAIHGAIQDAVSKTGFMPGEIVMDNHSFQKTKEAQWLKESTSEIGVDWTVTSNPQYKSIVERYFRHLNSICKQRYKGYLGEGMTAKRDDARLKPELYTKYAKHFLNENEIIANAVAIVGLFNSSILPSKGVSPNELYETSPKINCFKVNLFERVKLLTPQTEMKVVRGQINIIRSNVKYEYQLNAEMNLQYNDSTVIVRYEDLNDCIYIYDKATGKAIGSVPQKTKIHGAKVNQTAKDIELLNKNKGRKQGIKTQANKSLIDLHEEALKVNPNADVLLMQHSLPKSAVQDIMQLGLQSELANLGVNESLIDDRFTESEIELKAFVDEPVKKTRNNPFQVKGSMKIINPSDMEDEE
jgi:hypothetical protein